MSMIPVAGFLHYKNVQLTENCLRSLPRHLVERLVIVDNSEDGSAPSQIDGIPLDARIIRLGGNMGVAHGWNTIIKATPDARWWAIFNSDLEFDQSDIERLIASMKDHDLVVMGGFEAFGVHRRVIKSVGWFDENYHPAYCEDNDFHYRCQLAGTPMLWTHGVKVHVGSATITLDPFLRARNDVTYPKNVEYHHAKWGGHMSHETYKTPFDKGLGPAEGQLDIDRLMSQKW
jgi:GT2 family glycosyltransferase